MDQFLDAAVFTTGTPTATNGKKSSTGSGLILPVTNPIFAASASGGTRVSIYIYLNVFLLRTCSILLCMYQLESL